MSDLKEELMRIAADGADKARPLTVAEIIRRGNRRRARAIGQRSIGGLSVLGVSAAVILGGAVHPLHGPAGHRASLPGMPPTALTETTTTTVGTLTVRVIYLPEPAGKDRLLAIFIAGTSKESLRTAIAHVALGPIVPPVATNECVRNASKVVTSNFTIRSFHNHHRFDQSLPLHFNLGHGGTNVACDNEALVVLVSVVRGVGSIGLFRIGLLLNATSI